MGKYKGKFSPAASQSDSKSNSHRDGFFLKTKTINKKRAPLYEQKIKDEVNNSGNEKNSSNDQTEKQKKPFDKKQWRIKKYSNKYKVEQWKEMRKKKIMNQYQRSIKRKDERGVDVQQIYEKYGELNSDTDDTIDIDPKDSKGISSLENTEKRKEEVSKPSVKEGKKNRNNIHDRITRMKEEKLKKQEEFLKKKAEREEALKLSRQKKAERYRKLNKRTKKGQPIMKDRMEMLYEQIQKICQQ